MDNYVDYVDGKTDGRTDGWTDGRTDGRTDEHTDMTSYRDAQLHLKIQDSQARYGAKQPRIQTEVLGQLLIRSLIHSHR